MPKKETKLELPAWLKKENTDRLKIHRRINYIQVNLKTIQTLLAFFTQKTSSYRAKTSPWLRLLSLLLYSILILRTSQLTHLWILFLLLCAKLVFLPSEVILNTLKKLVHTLLFSSLFLLPSLFISPSNLPLFFIRIALLLLTVSLFFATTPWQDFILALRQLHFPSVLLLTMDITIKYIYVLGLHLEELLYSVRLRTLGQAVDRQVMGALLGQLYVSTKERTTQTYQAMLLRGYRYDVKPVARRRRLSLTSYDLGGLFELLGLLLALYFL